MSVHVARGRRSILVSRVQRCCDMLCNSGFVDDIVFTQ